MAEKAIRILIADDHAVVRNGFRRILEAQWDLEVLGEVSNGREAVEAVLERIAKKLKFGAPFRKTVQAAFDL